MESQTDVVHLFMEEAKESSVRRLAYFWQEGVDNWHHFTGNLYMDRIYLVEVAGACVERSVAVKRVGCGSRLWRRQAYGCSGRQIVDICHQWLFLSIWRLRIYLS